LMIYSGIFDRFPNLKMVCVEADAGWAPHYAYRMDHIYKRHRFWNKAPELSKLPSDYFFDNVYMTFQDDWTAVKMVDQLNVDRLLWANDFPHSDSTWPLSQELVAQHMAHLTPDQQRRILRDNCIELFGMDVPEQVAEVA
ncbi:MAG: amidohydrolase family protein, partial [Halioglobus sp.]